MNKKIYSLVWNKSLRQVVVASELATVKGGSGTAGEAKGSRTGVRRAALALAAAVALGVAPWVIAAPAHGQTNCSGATATAKHSLACGKGAKASAAGATAVGVDAV